MGKLFKPDIQMAMCYLDRLKDNIFTFQTFDDKGQDFAKARVFHGTLEDYFDELAYLNSNGAGVFVMVNKGDGEIHQGKKTCRTNANVISIRALFADADGVPLESIIENAPPPHIVVESSPGKWHVYWLTSDTKLDDFKGKQQAIAQKFGTDPAVNDLARVMRLPGFYHLKGEPYMTRLVLN